MAPGLNLLGIDVSGMDVRAFLAGARALFPILALTWLLLVARARKAGGLLAGVLLANAWAFAITNLPLPRLYALGPSLDRVGNVALCQVVAAGGYPLHTWLVGQLHFEPFWSLLVAAVSGWDPEHVLLLYPWFGLVTVLGFALAMYLGLAPRPADGVGRPAPSWTDWERALIAGFATLMASTPLDFVMPHRVPWAMTFLLKPNHAVALILFPPFLRLFAGVRTWRGRIGAGLLLHLMAWAFVLHMAFTAVGLVAFAALSILARQPNARREAGDVAAAIGVNALIVSPYLVMLVLGYPFLQPNPSMAIPASSAHLLEATARTGVLFPLALWGAWVAHRRGDRMGRLLAGQLVGAVLVWAGYLVLGALQLARERDEAFYWLRFLTALCAGVGAWDLAPRVAALLRGLTLSPPWRAVGVAVLALPWSLPYWWDPPRMDSYFAGSLEPLSPRLVEPTTYLRRHTPPTAVVAGDLHYARWVAALGARRSLMGWGLNPTRDWAQRRAAWRLLALGTDAKAVRRALSPYGVQYFLVTPELLTTFPGLTLADLESRPHLERVSITGDPGGDFVAIFRIRPEGA